MHGGLDERRPRRIPFGRVVAVEVAVANRSDWPPKIVVVLGVEDGDIRVVYSLRHRRKQAGVLRDIPPGHGGNRAHDPVIDRGLRRFPETGDLGLLGGAARTALAAERLDFGVVARPYLTRECGRRTG